MAFIWCYKKNPDLEENEERDIQICVPGSEQASWVEKIKALSVKEVLSYQLTKLQEKTPVHVDHPRSNFYFDNVSYKVVQFAFNTGGKDVIKVKDSVIRFELTEQGILTFLLKLSETNRTPSIYGNHMPVFLNDEEVKLNFWGSYEGIPAYF